MIATHYEITTWSMVDVYKPFFEKLRTLLRERPSLFVGISGQDINLQSQFVVASCNGPAVGFPPARVTFSADAIGVPQREILQAVHGNNYPPNQNAITSSRPMAALATSRMRDGRSCSTPGRAVGAETDIGNVRIATGCIFACKPVSTFVENALSICQKPALRRALDGAD